MKMLPKVPELSEIHKQVKHRCILDGELAVLVDGKPDFFEIQRRSLTSNNFKIHLQAQKHPASFITFDILYDIDHETISLPLMERKRLLQAAVNDSERLAVSRYTEQNGIAFYQLAEAQDLEGIVAKRRDSKYYFDKRTKDWIKIKNLQDDDFAICGYIQKEANVLSVILGQYQNGKLTYKGHVTLGVSSEDFHIMTLTKKLSTPLFDELPVGNEDAVWLEPKLVCTVKYMMKTAGGGMRQPIFKGIRFDKAPQECISKINTQAQN